tara:strand:+ start:251 stop:622 length:372 start_codon:yes stop_codon:yes gene_type:complete
VREVLLELKVTVVQTTQLQDQRLQLVQQLYLPVVDLEEILLLGPPVQELLVPEVQVVVHLLARHQLILKVAETYLQFQLLMEVLKDLMEEQESMVLPTWVVAVEVVPVPLVQMEVQAQVVPVV